MPVEHFKNEEAYHKNLAYRHIHGIPFRAESVVVGGKEHEVKHSTDEKRKRIDAEPRAGHKSARKAKTDKQAQRKIISKR